MSKTIFQHLANITHLKVDPTAYTESDWKSYSPYMINKWLSMYKEYAHLMDHTQKYYTLPKCTHYKMLSGVLPKKKVFTKYIKGTKSDKFNPELVDILYKHYEVSKDEIKTYIKLFFGNKLRILSLVTILESYGYDKKQIKKLIKI